MAGTKALTPKRFVKKEDRDSGKGGFITLKKTKDSFVGFALFIPDLEAADNPGWYEYPEHYTPATGYMPCPGAEDCPLCEEGDDPSTRAKSVWLVDDEIKVFNMNYYVISDFEDILSEGDNPVLGQAFRIKKQEGKGKFSILPKQDKLTKTELKKALAQVPEDYLEKIATRQMRRVLEELGLADTLEDDENAEDEKDKDDDKEEKSSKKSSAKKGKPAEEEPEAEEDASFDPEEEDSAEELAVTVVKKKKDNILDVQVGDGDAFEIYGTDEVDLTGYSKGDDLVVSIEKDGDGDFVVSEVAEVVEGEVEPEADADGDAPTSYEDAVVTVVSVNDSDDTLTVKDEDDNEFELFFLDGGEDDNGRDWSELDLNDFEEDQEIKITAALDEDKDMLASVFPEAAKKKAGSKKASTGKKSSKKK